MRQDREIRPANEVEGGDRIWIPGLTVPNLAVEDVETRLGRTEAEETVITLWTIGADAVSTMVELVVEPDHLVWITTSPVGTA